MKIKEQELKCSLDFRLVGGKCVNKCGSCPVGTYTTQHELLYGKIPNVELLLLTVLKDRIRDLLILYS